MVSYSERSTFASVKLVIFFVTLTYQFSVPCLGCISLGLETGCCPRFGLQIGCQPCCTPCCQTQALQTQVCPNLDASLCGCGSSCCNPGCGSSCCNPLEGALTTLCSTLGNLIGSAKCLTKPKAQVCPNLGANLCGSCLGCNPLQTLQSQVCPNLDLEANICCLGCNPLQALQTQVCPNLCVEADLCGSSKCCNPLQPIPITKVCLPCPCDDTPVIPQVIECGPPCPPPRLPNLPFQVESPCTPCAPSCKQYDYRVEKSYCKPCDCNQPLLNLPPAFFEIPFEEPACPCASYKYKLMKAFEPCSQTKCIPEKNLPFRTEMPCCAALDCCNFPTSDCSRKYPYKTQRPMKPLVNQPERLNVGYNIVSPAPKIDTCFCNLKPKVDRIVIPRKCPCICDKSLKGCSKLPLRSGFDSRSPLMCGLGLTAQRLF